MGGSITSDTTTAIQYSTDGETFQIERGVLVYNDNPVFCTKSQCTLTNDGYVVSSTAGMVLASSSDDFFLDNEIYGRIKGKDAIIFYSSSITIDNNGEIVGSEYGLYRPTSPFETSCIINNSGDIFGATDGIFLNCPVLSFTINNTGKIEAGVTPIVLDTDSTVAITINNNAGGLIQTADTTNFAAIYTNNHGTIHLNNSGTINAIINLDNSDGADVIVNRGKILGGVYLGAGKDLYKDIGAGVVSGPVHGGNDADRFVAGPAHEIFYGEADADTFAFNSVTFSPPSPKHDNLMDFSHAQADKIDVHVIDADVTHGGHQHFVFIGGKTFAQFHAAHPSVVGMVRFDAVSHTLQGNVNGNFTNAEFVVGLPGVSAFGGGDLILA